MLNAGRLLNEIYKHAEQTIDVRSVVDAAIAERIEFVATCLGNRAGVRLVMSCMLAKIDDPSLDPREPITEIDSSTSFSGRKYDEQFLTNLITEHRLPCNNTTAFLTPAFRNFTKPFTLDSVPKGRPQRLYRDAFQLLDDVATGRCDARAVLEDTLRHLIVMRNEQDERMQSLLGAIQRSNGTLPPSSEAIVRLLEQHLQCKNSARLPVLGVAAA